jgi:putative flippase GtrA
MSMALMKNKISRQITTKHQLLRFLCVGLLNTLFGYICFAFFIYLGLHYAVALGLATAAGILFNFQTTGKIVFNNTRAILIFKFIGVYAFLYILNVGAIKLLKPFSTNYYLTDFLALIPITGIAFILNKFFVFTELDSK